MIDGRFQCYGLEDPYREVKVAGETRIPAGRYKLDLRTEGGFDQRYRERFGSLHKGMLWVRNVPGFTWILIHCGNTPEDTEGCLLVGRGWTEQEGKPFVSSSVAAYREMYPKVADAIIAGNDVMINYVDAG